MIAGMARLLSALLVSTAITTKKFTVNGVKVTTSDTTTTTYNYLFNLDDDPNEDTNLWDELEYTNLKKNCASRMAYWMDYLIDPQVPDTTDATAAYAAAGGYVPWLETPVEHNTLVVGKKYEVENPPNIVFILADDWGWNDAGWRSTYMKWTTPNIDRIASESVLLQNH